MVVCDARIRMGERERGGVGGEGMEKRKRKRKNLCKIILDDADQDQL